MATNSGNKKLKIRSKKYFSFLTSYFLLFTKKIVIFLVRTYQIFLTPILGKHNCRFAPTCSQYMIEAIEKKGLIKGFFLGISRLLKCQPFSKKSGFDPVK